MKVITKQIPQNDGSFKRVPKDMHHLLNYNILKLLNRTHRCGPFDMPELHCNTKVFPDYLALYKQKSLYKKSPLTAICFYSYDNEFDGRNGLFWAIYFNDKKRLAYFKKRFKGVKFFISPDYSIFGDIHKMENLYRIFRAHIVALWFSLELHAVVIPNLSYADSESFPIYFSGLEKCSVVAISTKSHIRYKAERRLFEKAIRYAVDNLPLKAIVVYSACGKDETCLKYFKYALDCGIKVIIPDNTLRDRNMKREVANGKR